ncbi:MAG: IS3 family transposase [Chloroflexi bacterium]|nr:IS3 family transposase [Chloroflexota bacterium]
MVEPSVALKRQLVKTLNPQYGTVRALCDLFDLAPSSFYHAGPGRIDRAADQPLLHALQRLAGRYPTYGYRRLTILLRRQAAFAHVNSKRVRRLMKQAHLRAKRPRRRMATTDSRHGFQRYPNLVRTLVITRPDQVWACDLTYIVLSSGEIVFLAIVLDVFTRTIRGWALGQDLTHLLAVHALQKALRHGVCETHHSDQGVQYATPAYTQLLTARGIQISMSEMGQACLQSQANPFGAR